jgi:multidrug transporter EmrE-like cation transporter
MTQTIMAILGTVALSTMAVIGDYFLKIAGRSDTPFKTWWFMVGLAAYAASAFGAVYVLKHLKLATVGVVYCLTLTLLLTAMGVFVFRETLHFYEVMAIVMALLSLCMLARFA